MTDIAKCNNTDCDKREHCYRFTCSSEGDYQVWLMDMKPADGGCDHFVRDEEEEE